MDYRDFNTHVDAYSVKANVCTSKFREWRQQGLNINLLDLKSTYLQVCINEPLWPYKTIIFQGRKYCPYERSEVMTVGPPPQTT